jgi:hypothetical protein
MQQNATHFRDALEKAGLTQMPRLSFLYLKCQAPAQRPVTVIVRITMYSSPAMQQLMKNDFAQVCSKITDVAT